MLTILDPHPEGPAYVADASTSKGFAHSLFTSSRSFQSHKGIFMLISWGLPHKPVGYARSPSNQSYSGGKPKLSNSPVCT